MQVDTAVELVLLLIQIHLGSPWDFVVLSQVLTRLLGDVVFRSAASQQKTNFLQLDCNGKAAHPRRP